MTNINDKLREHIARYNALQEREGPKNRLACWESYRFHSGISPKWGWRVDTIDGVIMPTVPDSEEVIDAFANLVVEATLALGKTYLSGVTYKNMCRKPLGQDGLPEILPVEEGKQLAHCHLWEKSVCFDRPRRFFDDDNINKFDPIQRDRNQKPIASVYLPRPKGILLPYIALLERIAQDGRIVSKIFEYNWYDGIPIMYTDREYVTEQHLTSEQVCIEKLLRKDIAEGKNE